MQFFQRILAAVQEDLGALVPGNSIPLNGDAMLRLLLYFGLIVFAVRLFLVGPGFQPFRSAPSAPFPFDERRAPEAPAPSDPSVENPRNI